MLFISKNNKRRIKRQNSSLDLSHQSTLLSSYIQSKHKSSWGELNDVLSTNISI